MDGGSTDGSVAILEAIHDPRLTWVSEPDRGQSHALNKGLKRATGSFITYVNSDDLLAPHAISSAVIYLMSHPTTDLILGDCNYIDAEGKNIGLFKGKPLDLPSSIAGFVHVMQPGTFWNRRVFDVVGDFDESMHYLMDYDHLIRAALAGCQIDYVPSARASYRIHVATKTSSQASGFWHDWHLMLDKIYSRQNLPADVLAVKEISWDRLLWHDAKIAWLNKEYANARPTLWRFLRGNKRMRQALSATMLIDSYLQTPFTRLVASGCKALRGVEILSAT